MAKNERRRQHTGARVPNQSNDQVRALLTRTERRLRRIAGSRGKPELRRAYKIAADRVRRAIAA